MSKPNSTERLIHSFQSHLLTDIIERIPHLSTAVRAAFVAAPRHMFLEQYRTMGDASYIRVDSSNLVEHLPVIYRDKGMGIYGDDASSAVTISTPSLVLQMLEWLQLSPGMRVFEVGTGSGWNAALLGLLVGPEGRVETVEIIPELAARAREALQRLGLDHVDVIAGDGGVGPSSKGTFDRAVFTAGSYDIPQRLHEQVALGGLLLFVLKCPGGGDVLLLLRKEDDHFCLLNSRPCVFVPVTGATRDASLDSEPLERFEPWRALSSRQVRSRPLICGSGRGDFAARTFELRSFLSIVDPSIRYFLDAADRDSDAPPWAGCTAFGLWLDAPGSLALARGTAITTYGSPEAGDRLDEGLLMWLELGMPSAAGLDVRAYASARAPKPGPGEWVVDRRDTRFIGRHGHAVTLEACVNSTTGSIRSCARCRAGAGRITLSGRRCWSPSEAPAARHRATTTAPWPRH